jgi:hypothetical protein
MYDVRAHLLLSEVFWVLAVVCREKVHPAVIGLGGTQALVLKAEMLRESLQRCMFMVVAKRILILFIVSIFFASWQPRKRLSGLQI